MISAISPAFIVVENLLAFHLCSLAALQRHEVKITPQAGRLEHVLETGIQYMLSDCIIANCDYKLAILQIIIQSIMGARDNK